MQKILHYFCGADRVRAGLYESYIVFPLSLINDQARGWLMGEAGGLLLSIATPANGTSAPEIDQILIPRQIGILSQGC